MPTAEEQFASFFHASWASVYRTVYGIAGTHEDTEEAVQAAFAKAFSRWRRISRMAQPQAYVRKMAVNEALSSHRRSRRARERLGDLAAGPRPADEAEWLDVWAAVSALPPRQRAVIVLRFYEGLSESDIADVLGCRPGTVKSQAHAALTTLRTRHPDLHPQRSTGDPR